MQKKSLDTNIGVQDYNKKLFTKSIELIGACRNIPINQVSALHRQQIVKKSYNAIEQKLRNILKIMRNFTETEKPTFNNPIDLALQILQQTKLQVDIKIRKQKQQKNTVKLQKSQPQSKTNRPQDIYPQIKPFQNFDMHSHQQYLQDGQISELKPCQHVIQPSDISNQCMYVDTIQKLDQAIKEMKQFTQIAVDVQHSSKSYEGFTCLIQISTRVKDYIIDVFPIWACVSALQEVIGDPSIVKVMHGAQMDTKWLQRDFNIHIVNLFDTHRASRVLGMQKFSYAFLLHHYCNVSTNKKYQLADWRCRPLAPELLSYARTDTHYLLTIFDYLRMDLQKQAKSVGLPIRDVLRDIQKSSHEVTLSNVQLNSFRTKEQYLNWLISLKGRQQFKAIESIFEQIDYVARRLDQNFQDLVGRNQLGSALSVMRDLIYNQTSKTSKQARIQRVISYLNKNAHPDLKQAMQNIKSTMLQVLCNKKSTPAHPISQKQQNPKPQQIQIPKLYQTPIQTTPIPQFTRFSSHDIHFNQFMFSSFKKQNKEVKISFQPISSFLAHKYGVEQKKEEEDEVMQEEDVEEDELGEDVEVEGQAQEDMEIQGRIQFKRMNPNVVYTLENQDPEIVEALKSQKPRKVRRQAEYEDRIRNQKGNVYDLLGDN